MTIESVSCLALVIRFMSFDSSICHGQGTHRHCLYTSATMKSKDVRLLNARGGLERYNQTVLVTNVAHSYM